MTSHDKDVIDDTAKVLASVVNPARRLRDQAEARLWTNADLSPQNVDLMTSEKIRQVVHELRVHQIELEMQNEELREAQVALERTRARYFDLYDLAPLSYITLSEHGMIEQVNFAAANLLEMTRSDLVKKPISRFIDMEDQDTFYLKRKLLLETSAPQMLELKVVKQDGTKLWVKMVVTLNHNELGCIEIRAALNNINDRKILESQLINNELKILHENVTLHQARLSAEKESLAKSNCLSSMSHELRTPLNAILGFAQLLTSPSSKLSALQERNVNQIIKAGWYLLDLVNEILDLAQVESGQLILSHDVIWLGGLLNECKDLIELQAKERQINLDFSSMTTAYFVKADYTRLKQVFINLLTNAIKYSDIGGHVAVYATYQPQGRIRISIQDDGPGLSEDKIEHLFEPFNRLGQEKGTAEGTGIGLVVCKRLINLMGGIVGVDTTVKKGCEFWVEMPLIADD